MRPATFVPESKPVDDLLSRDAGGPHPPGRSWSTSTAAPAGLVTIEDILEEIVGEITDEYDVERPPVERLADGSVRVTARLPVEDLGELFDVELPTDEVETVGGLLAQALGRVPIPGAEAEVGGLRLVAEGTTGRRNRIDTVLVSRVEPGDEQDNAGRGEHADPGTTRQHETTRGNPPMPDTPAAPVARPTPTASGALSAEDAQARHPGPGRPRAGRRRRGRRGPRPGRPDVRGGQCRAAVADAHRVAVGGGFGGGGRGESAGGGGGGDRGVDAGRCRARGGTGPRGGRAGPRGRSGRHGPRHGDPVSPVQDPEARPYRAGFACFVGRPNAGKSTLTNAIVGTKIAITSNKPQTTRHVIRAVLHRPDSQLVLVDTPGLHRPRTLLGERLNDLVRSTWSEVDVIGLCIPADEPVGRGDRFITGELAELKATVLAVVTKTDLVDKRRLAEQLLAVSKLGEFAEIVPVSAVSGHQVDTLVDVMTKYLPPSPQLYPDDMLTDEPEQVMVAELIREAALEGVRDELPHSIAVVVEEMIPEGQAHEDLRRPVRGAAQPEGHRARAPGEPAQGGRHQRPQADRGAARRSGLPRPARAGREGLAARPEATAQAGLLTHLVGGARPAALSPSVGQPGMFTPG